MIVGLHHVAISVPDLERGLSFYRDQLGFEVVQRSEFDGTFEGASRAIGLANVKANMAMLKTPNSFVELWEYHHPVPEDRTARPCDYGYPHMALQVRGITEEYERLKAVWHDVCRRTGRLRHRLGHLRARSFWQCDRAVRNSRSGYRSA